ncbi:MAG: immunity 50 family protein, partial [Candidatus Obscuribacterales bacterium]|nr:immunity 50 family protein [Candidatus Obscuribacterales bacterium]
DTKSGNIISILEKGSILSQLEIEHILSNANSAISVLEGADQLFGWFGYWPTFHDAEIIELHLKRQGYSLLKIHTWHTSHKIDQQGLYEQDKHAIVTFQINDISDLELHNFNHQNVIAGLAVKPVETGFQLTIVDCYGLAGNIVAENISIAIASAP